MNRRSVARGAALGVFFGVLVPIAQIAFAAGFAVVLRANLPVVAAATLVSSPLTYAPIYVAAYQVGTSLLGESASAATAAAISGAVIAYVLALLAWRMCSSRGCGAGASPRIECASIDSTAKPRGTHETASIDRRRPRRGLRRERHPNEQRAEQQRA